MQVIIRLKSFFGIQRIFLTLFGCLWFKGILQEVVLLEFNYLSSPKKLMEYQSKYFEDELEEIDILNLQEISLKNNKIKTKSFLINKFTEWQYEKRKFNFRKLW